MFQKCSKCGSKNIPNQFFLLFFENLMKKSQKINFSGFDRIILVQEFFIGDLQSAINPKTRGYMNKHKPRGSGSPKRAEFRKRRPGTAGKAQTFAQDWWILIHNWR